jgi:tetratricopeptide (TPR) repeat protein
MSKSEPALDDPAARALDRAQQALAQQRWQHAATLARQALQELSDPGQQARAHLTLARACWHQASLISCCRHALHADELARQAADAPTEISAATLAAFALAELNLEQHALPLALRALQATQRPQCFGLLATALSCAAHVHARLADLEQAEGLHMRALSHARESGDVRAVQLAFDNLLLSFIFMHRLAAERGDTGIAEAVMRRSRVHLGQIRGLIDRQDLDAWRRLSLTCNLGELLSLAGETTEARALLEAGMVQARQLAADYSMLSASTALAELLAGQQQPEAALACLGGLSRDSVFGKAGYRLQMRTLQLTQTCCMALQRPAEATAVAARIEVVRQAQRQAQQEVLLCLPAVQ